MIESLRLNHRKKIELIVSSQVSAPDSPKRSHLSHMPKKNRCLLCISSLCIFLMLVGEWKTKRFISELPGKVAAGQETVRCSETGEEGLNSMQEGFLLFFGLDVERQWYNTFILTLSLPRFHLKTTSKSAVSSTIKLFFSFFLFALACDRIFIRTHSIESRFVIGLENILFAGVCTSF